MNVLLVLAGAGALLLFLLHTFAYLIRWYEKSRHNPAAGPLWEHPLRGAVPFLIEYLCHIAVLCLWAADLVLSLRRLHWGRRRPKTLQDVAREQAPPPAPPPQAGRPIVFLHGMGMRGLTVVPLALRFRRAGRTVRLFTYGPPGRALDAYARQLHDTIEDLCRREGFEAFDAVAHSLGGLVLRRYLALFDGGRRIRRLVTIGTPHGGSELWRLSPFASARQLQPGGDTLRRLDEAGLPPGVEATAIASDFDQLVIPGENARWEAPGVRNPTVAGAGHNRLIFSGEVFRLAREALS